MVGLPSSQFQDAIASVNHPANEIKAIATEYIYRNSKKYVLQYNIVMYIGDKAKMVDWVWISNALPIINTGPDIKT